MRHLVEMHGGTIEAYSEGINKGARFTVVLPLKIESHSSQSETETTSFVSLDDDKAFHCSPLLDGLRILLVDDEADTRDFISEVLTQCGADVRCCESTAEALAALQEWSPELLISDIGLPGEDGYALIKKVRGLGEQTAQIPAIALTAYASHEDRLRALSAGFQVHIAKPVEPEELVNIVTNVARRSRAV